MCGSQRGWFVDPELGAAPEDDGVVVEYGGHDESAVQQRGGHRGVPELANLVAEPAVRNLSPSSSAEAPHWSKPLPPEAAEGKESKERSMVE
nr:unnamed protein product [Digitaria exilis]